MICYGAYDQAVGRHRARGQSEVSDRSQAIDRNRRLPTSLGVRSKRIHLNAEVSRILIPPLGPIRVATKETRWKSDKVSIGKTKDGFCSEVSLRSSVLYSHRHIESHVGIASSLFAANISRRRQWMQSSALRLLDLSFNEMGLRWDYSTSSFTSVDTPFDFESTIDNQ